MPVPIVYRKSSEVLASIPFNDIAAGLGFQTYYCAKNETPAAVLSADTVYSSVIETTGNATHTFDSSVFNFPRVCKGTALFNCGYSVAASTGEISVQLFKIATDGSTTTNISSAVSSQQYGAGSSGMFLISIPLTETVIAVGEKIRLTAIQTGPSVSIGHDPKGRPGTVLIGTNYTTQMAVHIPFKVDF